MKRSSLTRRAPLRRRPGKTAYARRARDWSYMAWVNGQSCLLAHLGDCAGPIEADHCGDRGLGQKAPDSTCVPLCTKHHRERTDMRGAFGGFDAEGMRLWRRWAVQNVQEAYARWRAAEEVCF